MPTARELALLILDGLFETGAPTQPGRVSGLILAEFQAEGAARLRAIMDRRGGAILADSVGLGKTYTALTLIGETLHGGGDVLVIVPAALRGQWARALRRVPSGTGAWRLLSHTQLARGIAVGPPRGRRLVVVDEAHRFRNPSTLRYAALARLTTPDARVLLITATPVNNGPFDLHHLLRLFAPDDAFRDVGVPSLLGAFQEGDVGPVVRAVVVRRTRRMVHDRFGASAASAVDAPRFPHRARPRLVQYERPTLPALVDLIGDLELAPHASRHRAGGGQEALLRLSLLKRLDSSPAAFDVSLDRLARLCHLALDAARTGHLVAPRDAHGPTGRGDDDPLQLTLVSLVTRPAPPGTDLDALADSLRRDLDRIRTMRSAADGDPKRAALEDALQAMGGEKVVVFTEYRDTAESLWRELGGTFRVGRVDGGGAWLGRRRAGRRTVVERFAPRANGRPPPPVREGVDVLFATDVLAEGLNLQDARNVFCYDLPWNPVWLLQRIGRVDRLGSPHREVVPWLFVPGDGLEAVLGLRRRVRAKLGHIAATVGAEAAESLLERLSTAHGADPGDPVSDLVDEAEGRLDDPIERLRTLWIRNRDRAASAEPPGSHDGRSGPGEPVTSAVVVPVGHVATRLMWITLVRTETGMVLLQVDRQGRATEADQAAVAVIHLALSEETSGLRPAGDGQGGQAIPISSIRAWLADRQSGRAPPPPLGPSAPELRLVRRLRRELAGAGAALDPDRVRRVDALLTRLSAPLHPARAARIERLLQRRQASPTVSLIEPAEALLGDRASPTPTPSAAPQAMVVAALRIHPADPLTSG